MVRNFVNLHLLGQHIYDHRTTVQRDDSCAQRLSLDELVRLRIHRKEIASNAGQCPIARLDGADKMAASISLVELAVDDVYLFSGTQNHKSKQVVLQPNETEMSDGWR